MLAETFLVVWRRSDIPRADARLAWVFGVARRLVLAHHREGASRPVLTAAPPEPDRPSPASDSSERVAAVQEALATLGDVDRELILLTVWDGLTPAQAVASLGVTAGAARVRLHRVRARLEDQLRPAVNQPVVSQPVVLASGEVAGGELAARRRDLPGHRHEALTRRRPASGE
ncbi:MAG: sigma factor-like helix-turn-helix DNA-binding protein [Tetrasphaera sp.]